MELLSCIAIAILFEAGGEPTDGQLAVAQVIRNRMADPRYPSQNKQQYYNALYIAWLSSIREDVTDGATHYHATGSLPKWADTQYLTKKINNHIFYYLP